MNRLVSASALVGGVLVASYASAFSLKVTPIPIVITGGATSTIVEISNEGADVVRVQATTYEWSQAPSGEDKLSPSTELLVFPSMVTLKPGETRKVRVATQGTYDAAEKPYRVIFGELPSNVSAPEDKVEVVKVIGNVSVPIFLKPPGAIGVPKIEGMSVSKDHVRFGVRNTGNAHALVEKIQLDFTDDAGKVLSTNELAGWYVLPGLVRPFDVEITGNLSCAGAKKLVITASSRESGKATATTDQLPCAVTK